MAHEEPDSRGPQALASQAVPALRLLPADPQRHRDYPSAAPRPRHPTTPRGHLIRSSPFRATGRDLDTLSRPNARPRQEGEHGVLPKEIADRLPPLYSQEKRGDEAIAQVKFFTPWTNWTWYVSEYDPDNRLCFGVVVGHEREFGYFSVDELEEILGPGGLTIERDLYWKPKPLKECL